MTVALVHGVPETAAIWGPLVEALDRDDVVTLSPPGFGSPVPNGFEATSDGYRDWLVGELEQLDQPIDLVGHDWGAGHALRAATERPDLIRKLVTDIAGTADIHYEWHDLAKVWQTPGDGEAFVHAIAAMTIDERIPNFVEAGMTEAAARSCAEANGEVMGTCILSLYRSAVQPRMTLWGDQYADVTDRPDTLVVIPFDDAYTGGPDLARRVAQRWSASVAELEGLGHWWMLQDPRRGADMLRSFLAA